jgi:hypothetical protein
MVVAGADPIVAAFLTTLYLKFRRLLETVRIFLDGVGNSFFITTVGVWGQKVAPDGKHSDNGSSLFTASNRPDTL